MTMFNPGQRVRWSCPIGKELKGTVQSTVLVDLPIIYLKPGDVMVKCDGDTYAVAVNNELLRPA
jgi:hypothetical protein